MIEAKGRMLESSKLTLAPPLNHLHDPIISVNHHEVSGFYDLQRVFPQIIHHRRICDYDADDHNGLGFNVDDDGLRRVPTPVG